MKQLDLGKTKVNKIFWTFVIPSILSMIFHTTAQFIDSAFIGRYVGENGLAAITMLSPFIMLLNGVSIMIVIGGVTYAGISRGKEELEKSNNYFNLTVMLIVGAAIVSTGIFLLINSRFDLFLKTDASTLGYIQDYGFFIGIFFIFNMINLTFNLFLNLDRKPILVVLVSSIGTVINVSLNYVFIVLMNMGMTGAALASGISQVIPTLVFLYIIIKKSSWRFRIPKIIGSDVKNIFLNGSSEMVNISSVAISGFILNKVILDTIGITGVAGYSIAMQLAGLVISLGFGVSDAIQSPLSFNFGAELYGRLKQILKKAITLNVVFGLLLGTFSFIRGDLFARILVTDPNTIIYAHHILRFYSFAFVLMGANVIVTTYYTSVDSPLISGILSICKSLLYLVIWLIILPPLVGENGIWLALLLTEVSTSVTAYFIYKKYPNGSKVRHHSTKPILGYSHKD